MKKLIVLVLTLVCVLCFIGCSGKVVKPVNTFDGSMKTYYEMSDGTWQTEGNTYKYKLEISGRMSHAAVDTTFVYLSNIENITFEQAWKAAGFSSNTADYFDIKEAVLVDIKTE